MIGGANPTNPLSKGGVGYQFKKIKRRSAPDCGEQGSVSRLAQIWACPQSHNLVSIGASHNDRWALVRLRRSRVTNLAKFVPNLCESRKDKVGGWGNAQLPHFGPQTLVLLETAFDEAWLTLKSVGNNTVKPDELARCVLRMAMEGERDPLRLHDGALERLVPATSWREAS